ncbi:Homeobox transcription factor [Quillaja saponaria]|uniref:Homeobox transcription factor n=1 Tax=Quillaja saponaria TaxID=32244 RepID=A0AAD7PG75_QUISA|nr:Homeobox transcription factor [Quillaja saponaria]
MSRKRDKPYFSRHVPSSAAKRHRPMPQAIPTADEVDSRSTAPSLAIRIDRGAVGYITYRTKDSADAAISAGLDPSFGITIDSKKVQVLWATDPLAQWREGVGSNKNNGSSSRLVRAEVPLRRHGRGNKLASAIVNPRSSDGSFTHDVPFRGREIIAYDDIL